MAASLLFPIASHAQEVPDEPVGAEIAYGMSFFEFDVCGDVEAGRIFRRLIIAKIKACSYSAAAREKFQAHIFKTAEGFAEALLQARAEGRLDQLNGPPAIEEEKINPHGGPKSCKEYRETSDYLERRERLMRYAKGEIGIDEALGEGGCPSGPAAL
ncbi:hypothetical protein [Dongia sp. agr-C8]